jgi:glycine/serine hydroxymethyltransferase
MDERLWEWDFEVAGAIACEERRQSRTIELIASENFTSRRFWRRLVPC